MEKKTISVHAVTVHVYTIAIVLLFLALFLLSLKYLHLKLAVDEFTHATIVSNDMQMHAPVSNVTDYATIMATTVAQYPSSSPLLSQSDALQSYVSAMSQKLKRDIVVMDTKKKILADTVVVNRGATYSYDTNNEINLTMKDEVARSFLETSQDYPSGVSEVVVPIMNTQNVVVGALLVSNFQAIK